MKSSSLRVNKGEEEERKLCSVVYGSLKAFFATSPTLLQTHKITPESPFLPLLARDLKFLCVFQTSLRNLIR